ncbi:zinc finger protein 701-like isoform X2 [Sitophilus oryzae]|uniref:Zinc finger protein 701-like isoform X2 n=1 Tax=Sitophilus oryzae TaxID=7048 RepID=A0A6J2X9Q3_SITOR|nr:zinc finger protein 701-like isoform X2 [Sitophilus oryzae]
MSKMEMKLLYKLNQISIRNVCGLCLSEECLRKISGSKLPQMIDSCFENHILLKKNLLKHICTACFRQIIRFYTFKQRVNKVQKILDTFLQEKSNELYATNNFNDHTVGQSIEVADNDISDLEKLKLQELENLHEEIYKKNIEINECAQKIISYNFGPPPLVPIQLDSSTVNDKPATENISEENIIPLPPLIPLKTYNTNDDHCQMISCDICLQTFNNMKLFQDHNCNKLSCNVCKKRFANRNELIIHLRGHRRKIKDYLCNICGKKYLSSSTFRVHMRTHTGEKPFKCNICDKKFVRWAGLKIHMVVHEETQRYRCQTCGKGFKISSNLYRHERLHTGINNYSCNYCEKSYNQLEHLTLHIRVHHTNEKPFLCSECGKRYVSLQRLQRHAWIHTGQKPFPCPTCPKAYTNQMDLKNHQLRMHEDKPTKKLFECSHCWRKYSHLCRLRKHLKYHGIPVTQYE